MVSPNAVLIKEPGDSDHEQEERDDRGEDLKRDRARVRQKVVLLKPSNKARPSSLARAPSCMPPPKTRATPPAGGCAEATLRDFAILQRYSGSHWRHPRDGRLAELAC